MPDAGTAELVDGGASPRSWWLPAPRSPRLQADELHVWHCSLPAVPEKLLAALSTEERQRALRFPHERHGRLWARSRALLRDLLAGYLELDAAGLRFVASARGKPALADGGAPFFNVSHAGTTALYAFSASTPVGVDVERPRERALLRPALAERALGEAQAARLLALPPAQRERGLLQAWVRREAASKCAGTGLAGPAPESLWTRDLPMEAGFAAAVAAPAAPLRLCCWQWRR